MADLNDVLVFCALYSGVVLYALTTTVAQRPPARARRD